MLDNLKVILCTHLPWIMPSNQRYTFVIHLVEAALHGNNNPSSNRYTFM